MRVPAHHRAGVRDLNALERMQRLLDRVVGARTARAEHLRDLLPDPDGRV